MGSRSQIVLEKDHIQGVVCRSFCQTKNISWEADGLYFLHFCICFLFFSFIICELTSWSFCLEWPPRRMWQPDMILQWSSMMKTANQISFAYACPFEKSHLEPFYNILTLLRIFSEASYIGCLTYILNIYTYIAGKLKSIFLTQYELQFRRNFVPKFWKLCLLLHWCKFLPHLPPKDSWSSADPLGCYLLLSIPLGPLNSSQYLLKALSTTLPALSGQGEFTISTLQLYACHLVVKKKFKRQGSMGLPLPSYRIFKFISTLIPSKKVLWGRSYSKDP